MRSDDLPIIPKEMHLGEAIIHVSKGKLGLGVALEDAAPDGHIYSFPWIEQLGAGKEAIQAIGDVPYINKKWLDYLGLEIPTTTDTPCLHFLHHRQKSGAVKPGA